MHTNTTKARKPNFMRSLLSEMTSPQRLFPSDCITLYKRFRYNIQKVRQMYRSGWTGWIRLDLQSLGYKYKPPAPPSIQLTQLLFNIRGSEIYVMSIKYFRRIGLHFKTVLRHFRKHFGIQLFRKYVLVLKIGFGKKYFW